MSRPRALDLFACSGGSATGLEQAGFDVIGVDWKPSHHWTGSGELHEADLSTADAVDAVIRAFAPDFVSSSPPCQRFSSATPTANRLDHPDLIDSTRRGIVAAGVPGWIENVATDAVPLTGFWIMLCGTHFDLWQLKRHRRVELIGWRTPQLYHDNGLCMYGLDADERRPVESVHEGSNARAAREERRQRRSIATVAGDGGCSPGFGGDKAKRSEWRRRATVMISGHGPRGEAYAAARRRCVGVFGFGMEGPGQVMGQNRAGPECVRWREAMGWLDGPRDRYSLAQAIPPVYAKWLGERFLSSRPLAGGADA